jgi:squalene-hopene/tetraprenyl-beta-curcumene cyclase
MLANMLTRVRAWKDMEPFYPDQTVGLPKTSESRGTESILNALVLTTTDARTGKLSPDTRLALDNMWALQLRSGEMGGSWAWLQFHNAPWEGDSQFYGTVLAAIATGTAPGDYQSEPAIQANIKQMRGWLLKSMAVQTPLDRVVLLWASAKLSGLLTPEQQKTIVDETLAKQHEDGGFSISSMVGNWKRRDNTPKAPMMGTPPGWLPSLWSNSTIPAMPLHLSAPVLGCPKIKTNPTAVGLLPRSTNIVNYLPIRDSS